ncbi:MAG: hypothetical protein Rubg2KO_33680 [Rubricoccaceae bacterium]
MLDTLPNAARLWLFALDRQPDADTLASALADIQAWLPTWASHGRPVPAQADALEGRVIAVGAVISPEDVNAGVSGCGIDAMQHAVEGALERHGLAMASALSVTYEADGDWHTAPRPAFRQLVRDGQANGSTRMLDLTHDTVGALRANGLARPAADTWAGRAFRLAA